MLVDKIHWYTHKPRPKKPNLTQIIAGRLRPKRDWYAYVTGDLSGIIVVYEPRLGTTMTIATIHPEDHNIIIYNNIANVVIPLADPQAIRKTIKAVNKIITQCRR